jgi:hypothetical protein
MKMMKMMKRETGRDQPGESTRPELLLLVFIIFIIFICG